MTQYDIATVVTVANTITLTRVPWHSVTLPVLLRSPIKLHLHVYSDKGWHRHSCRGRQYNYTYTCNVPHCDIATVVTVANTITLTRVSWQIVAFPLLLRSPKQLHIHVSGEYCDTATLVMVANTISLTRVPWRIVTLPLLLRSPIQLHLHVYCDTVWNCNICYGRK